MVPTGAGDVLPRGCRDVRMSHFGLWDVLGFACDNRLGKCIEKKHDFGGGEISTKSWRGQQGWSERRGALREGTIQHVCLLLREEE